MCYSGIKRHCPKKKKPVAAAPISPPSPTKVTRAKKKDARVVDSIGISYSKNLEDCWHEYKIEGIKVDTVEYVEGSSRRLELSPAGAEKTEDGFKVCFLEERNGSFKVIINGEHTKQIRVRFN